MFICLKTTFWTGVQSPFIKIVYTRRTSSILVRHSRQTLIPVPTRGYHNGSVSGGQNLVILLGEFFFFDCYFKVQVYRLKLCLIFVVKHFVQPFCDKFLINRKLYLLNWKLPIIFFCFHSMFGIIWTVQNVAKIDCQQVIWRQQVIRR